MKPTDLHEAATLIARADYPFEECFNFDPTVRVQKWRDIKPDSVLTFKGVTYTAENLLEHFDADFFRDGVANYYKLECSQDLADRIAKEIDLKKGFTINQIIVHRIKFDVISDELRANDIVGGVLIVLEPNDPQWPIARYEISILSGSNQFQRPNKVAILSARLLPAISMQESNE